MHCLVNELTDFQSHQRKKSLTRNIHEIKHKPVHFYVQSTTEDSCVQVWLPSLCVYICTAAFSGCYATNPGGFFSTKLSHPVVSGPGMTDTDTERDGVYWCQCALMYWIVVKISVSWWYRYDDIITISSYRDDMHNNVTHDRHLCSAWVGLNRIE